MNRLAAAALAVGILLPCVGQAQTGRNCAPRPHVLERLSDKFGETRKGIGLGSNNAVVEVFSSDKTGTWTITVTMPNGFTCLVAMGEAFEITTSDHGDPEGDPT